MEQLPFHIFLQFIKKGDRVVDAVAHLREFMMHAELAKRVGISIEDVMRSYGIDLGWLECHVSRDEQELVVLTRSGLQQLPTPECLASYLPNDRKPTPEEYRHAWEVCMR